MCANATTLPAPHLTRAGVGRLVTVLLSLVLTAAIYFGAAGTLEAPRAWGYYAGLLAYMLLAMAFLFLRFPGVAETVNARGKLNADVKAWDKRFGVAYTILLLLEPAVAGAELGRLRLAAVPAWLAPPAIAVTILAYALAHWVMVENRYAETGVRIQDERHHEVVSTGPYRFVRHPLYVSMILVQLVYPLAVGSWLAYAPGGAIAALLVWRTSREDGMLRRELQGYEGYAGRTRYRLLPGVW